MNVFLKQISSALVKNLFSPSTGLVQVAILAVAPNQVQRTGFYFWVFLAEWVHSYEILQPFSPNAQSEFEKFVFSLRHVHLHAEIKSCMIPLKICSLTLIRAAAGHSQLCPDFMTILHKQQLSPEMGFVAATLSVVETRDKNLRLMARPWLDDLNIGLRCIIITIMILHFMKEWLIRSCEDDIAEKNLAYIPSYLAFFFFFLSLFFSNFSLHYIALIGSFLRLNFLIRRNLIINQHLYSWANEFLSIFQEILSFHRTIIQMFNFKYLFKYIHLNIILLIHSIASRAIKKLKWLLLEYQYRQRMR